MNLGKCKICGGEPWISEWFAAEGSLYKVYCEHEDAETGWYENKGTAINIWDSWFAKHDTLVEKVGTFSFGQAIVCLKCGLQVARTGWNGKGIFIKLQVPDEHSKMTQSYIYIDTLELNTTNPNAPKGRVPWLASQTDMLATDWYIVENDK